MVIIKSPRYHDRTVLIARYKIPCGSGVDIRILYGAYKGDYHISSDTICKSPIESMKTRSGNTISMRAISLDELERKEDE